MTTRILDYAEDFLKLRQVLTEYVENIPSGDWVSPGERAAEILDLVMTHSCIADQCYSDAYELLGKKVV